MKDSTGLHSYAVVRGDTLLINYDSAYVLNKKTFKLYQDTYKRVQNGNPAMKNLLANYEGLIALQDSMLKSKEAYYQSLKSNFDSLVSHSNNFVDKTALNISAIDQSLSTATSQINNIKGLLDQSLEKLKKENRQRIKLVVGGFTVGVAAATLVFLITRQ
ncbi:hypothetical protein SAE01_25310 [Segetibacter aerophilus]|uniref:Uncharacterized protein n=2 Tax=Segetibacter aerophilus TaxID=670293 RepID=A0A512BDT1_9BACT|nr:hypothetical protein SAE01_25310 [Segetibacter aerophilus]